MAKVARSQDGIVSDEVWLFDQDNTDLGIVLTVQARELAASRGLDLVRLDTHSSPPRCQLRDAAEVQVASQRLARLAKSSDSPPKEIRLRVQTGAADRQTRQRSAASLLASGHRVLLRVELDPAKRSDPAPARALMDALIRDLAAFGTPAGKPQNVRGAVVVELSPR